MRKTLPTLAVLAAALAVTGVCLAGAKPGGKRITLKQKWVPGSYLQTVSTEVDQVTQFGGQEMPVKIAQEFTISVRIGKPDKAGAKKMTWEYKRVKQTMTGGGQTVSYDSAAPEKGDPNQAKVFGGMAKAKITMTVGPDGKIKKVTGMDKVWDELADKAPDFTPMNAVAMKKSMGNEMVKDMAEKPGQFFPTRPVAVGEQWVAKNDLDVPIGGNIAGKVKAEMKCELKSIEAAVGGGKRAVISMTGKLESTKPMITTVGMSKVTVRKLVTNTTGESKLNVDNPMLSEIALVQDGSMEVQWEGRTPGPLKSKFKTKMVMKVVKAPPSKNTPGK